MSAEQKIKNELSQIAKSNWAVVSEGILTGIVAVKNFVSDYRGILTVSALVGGLATAYHVFITEFWEISLTGSFGFIFFKLGGFGVFKPAPDNTETTEENE